MTSVRDIDCNTDMVTFCTSQPGSQQNIIFTLGCVHAASMLLTVAGDSSQKGSTLYDNCLASARRAPLSHRNACLESLFVRVAFFVAFPRFMGLLSSRTDELARVSGYELAKIDQEETCSPVVSFSWHATAPLEDP